ncbi:MAG: cytochrome D1 domain-containing protein [Chloroflexota bacterium]
MSRIASMFWFPRAFAALAIVLALLGSVTSVPRETSAQPLPLKIYVGLFKDNAVAVVNGQTNELIKTIAVPTGPHGLVATPDGRRVYVSSDGATTVTAIDSSKDEAVATIDVGAEPHGLAMTPDGRFLLVGGWGSDEVLMLDTATDQVVGRAQAGRPHNIAVSPDNSRAYIGVQKADAPAIMVLQLPSLSPVATVPMTGNPRGLSTSPDGKWVYVTQAGSDDVLLLDAETRQFSGTIPIGPSPHFPLFASESLGLVDSQGLGVLALIDVGSKAVQRTIAVGQRPHWTAVAPGGFAYVTNEASNDMTVIDLNTGEAITTVPVGNGPRKIALAGARVAIGTTQADARIARFTFPALSPISPGQTLTFHNDDSVPHTVTSVNRAFDSGEIDTSRNFRLTIDAPGTYEYFCVLHPYMRGSVVVQG